LAGRLGCDRRTHRSRIHRKDGGVAGNTSGGVSDEHGELRAVVGAGGGWSGVTGGSGSEDSHAALIPLIAQRGSARRYHAERSCLASRHCLAGRLRRNRRGNWSSVDGESGRVAGDTSSGVADQHGELRAVVRARRRWRGVAGRRGPRDSGAVLLPLIAQRSGPTGGHAEGGGLTCHHSLTCWLRRDRRSHWSCIRCEVYS